MTEVSEKIIKNEEYRDPSKLKKIRIAMVLLCIGILGQSMMVTGAINVSVSSIERAFSYNSSQIAFLDTAYNIAFAICAFIVGYAISKNKINWIGIGGIFISIGCICFILPVFIKGSFSSLSSNTNILCSSQPSITNDLNQKGTIGYLVMMCLAYAFIGIGSAPLHTLAISYVEERNSRENSGLFYGFYYSAAAFGPVLTFLLFFFFSKIPIRPLDQGLTLLTPDSENWIGAYWLIYVIGAILTFLVAVPMMIFPSISPIYNETLESEVKKMSLKNFLTSIKNILSNIAYICICIGMFFDGILNNGIGVFMSKYVESQFQFKPDKAGLLVGVILVLGAAIGLFAGGYSIKRFKWSNKQLLKRITIFSFIGAVSLGFLFIHCSSNNINGVIHSDKGIITGFEDKTCSANCHCSLNDYLPVCVNNEDSFFSPCSLGCNSQEGTTGFLEFRNCVCFSDKYKDSSVKQGKCSKECNLIIIFMIFGFISLIIEFIIYIPQISLTMEILNRRDKLFGVSVQQILLRISYFIGPLIYGSLFDMSCKIFNHVSGIGSFSNCIDYFSNNLSLYMGITTIALKLLASAFLGLGTYFIRD